MTAQVGDKFFMKGKNYSIVAMTTPLEFHPSKLGITPQYVTTACWAGFWCVYNVTEEGIFLKDLYVNSKDDNYPKIEGIDAIEEEPNSYSYMGHHLYKNLNMKIDYTGKILVGRNFINEYYIHMGYQRPWAYEVLIELVFENGKLIEKNDESNTAEELRKQLKNEESLLKKGEENISKFVNNSFSLDYNTKAWWLFE